MDGLIERVRSTGKIDELDRRVRFTKVRWTIKLYKLDRRVWWTC